MKRDDAFRLLARHLTDELVVATYTSAFDWLAIRPHPLNYFAVGVMGLASSHGLGLALVPAARAAPGGPRPGDAPPGGPNQG